MDWPSYKVIKYCETVYERSGKNNFWLLKNSGEVLSKLKDIGNQAPSLSTYDFSTLYTTLPHTLIKEKLLDLIERTFYKKEGKLYPACNDKKALFTPMGTNCAPPVADLFLFCYERDFMKDLSGDNHADIIKAFNSTSRYLDDLLNIDNPYFEGMVNQIYPSELQLKKANTLDTEAPFLD